MVLVNAKVLGAEVGFVEQPLVVPLQLSTGSITSVVEAKASVTVRVGDCEATGRGSIYLSVLWAWPDAGVGLEVRQKAAVDLCERIAGDLSGLVGGEAAHPLELGLRLGRGVDGLGFDGAVPDVLALKMCASPFDAAIHDAVGHALKCSALDLYEGGAMLPSADKYFGGEGMAAAAIGAMFVGPHHGLDAWWIVNKSDVLDEAMRVPIGRGIRCFKLKIMGCDAQTDAERTADVYRVAKQLGVKSPALSIDSNEANVDAASVSEYLDRLEAIDGEAYEALGYIEQPTGRDITKHKFDWRAVSRRKAVMLDEGLTSLSLLNEAKDQGWTGFALKTCKGHSFTLCAAAWAAKHGLLISMQDLTNPGLSAIHAAVLSLNLPTINGVELNSPQFTPRANEQWLPRLSGLFELTGGRHRLSDARPLGLGSEL